MDAIWDDVLYCKPHNVLVAKIAANSHLALNIRIGNDELDLLNENKTNRVQVTGGKGNDYVGVLGVYHHMHCLNNIRRLLSWDYYGPKLAGEKHMEGFSREHSRTSPPLVIAPKKGVDGRNVPVLPSPEVPGR